MRWFGAKWAVTKNRFSVNGHTKLFALLIPVLFNIPRLPFSQLLICLRQIKFKGNFYHRRILAIIIKLAFEFVFFFSFLDGNHFTNGLNRLENGYGNRMDMWHVSKYDTKNESIPATRESSWMSKWIFQYHFIYAFD